MSSLGRRLDPWLDPALGVVAAVLALAAFFNADITAIDPRLHRPDLLGAVATGVAAGSLAWRRTRPRASYAVRARAAYGEVMELVISLGGTITGEHGVGRLKRPWLADYLGPDALALNQRIKHALDPQGILNPGAMFDPADPAG